MRFLTLSEISSHQGDGKLNSPSTICRHTAISPVSSQNGSNPHNLEEKITYLLHRLQTYMQKAV